MSEHLCVQLVPLFDHLSLEELRSLHKLVHDKVYQKGEIIFSPETLPQLTIVASGQMKIYRLATSGKEQLLRVAEGGDYEGEGQLFGVENDNLYGEALTKTRVCTLFQSDFQTLLQTDSLLSLKLLKVIAQKMSKVEQQTQFLTMEKIEERLAYYLLDLAKASEDASLVHIPMTMKELATYLGTSPETLSRKFKHLERKGWIARTRRTVQIRSQEALEDI